MSFKIRFFGNYGFSFKKYTKKLDFFFRMYIMDSQSDVFLTVLISLKV